MPQAKPTQVIVHRIEMQQSERALLTDYLENKTKQQWVNAGANAFKPLAITGASIYLGYLGVNAYAAIERALLSIDPLAAIDEAFGWNKTRIDPVTGEERTVQPTINPLTESGDVLKDVLTGVNPLDPLEGTGPNGEFTEEDLENRREYQKQLEEEVGFLNSIIVPFGLPAIFPKWL